MRWTERMQGLRLMEFEEVCGRTHRGVLSRGEAAEILGVSERTFRRWRDRYEAEGAEGLYDRRLGRASAPTGASARDVASRARAFQALTGGGMDAGAAAAAAGDMARTAFCSNCQAFLLYPQHHSQAGQIPGRRGATASLRRKRLCDYRN